MNITLSRAFIPLSLFFVLGVGLAPYLEYDAKILVGIIIALLLIGVIFYKEKLVLLLAFCIIALVFGIFRLHFAIPKVNESVLGYYNGKEVTITGIISGEPDIRSDKINLSVSAEKIVIDGAEKQVSGKVLVQVPRYPEYQYGDGVEIKGKLKEPFESEEFSYKNYLSVSEIYSVMYNPEIKVLGENKGSVIYKYLFSVKHQFQNSIKSILPEPQSSFLGGLLLGDKKGMGEAVLENFNKTGLTHIVALSGFNITIIISALGALFLTFFKRNVSFVLILTSILAFVLLTGAQASVVRAAIMGSLALLAIQLGRKKEATRLLVLAGLVMIAINPIILRFDVGFQLSFMATLGLIYFGPIFSEWLKKLSKWIREPLALTLAAQLATFPIIIYYFGYVSVIAPISNILVLPLIPITMFLGFVSGLAGMLWQQLGEITGYITWAALTYTLVIAEKLGNVSLATVNLAPSNIILPMAIYAVFTLWLWRRQAMPQEEKEK